MEAQRLLHGFCSNPAIPPIQNPKKPFFMIFNPSLDHSKRWASFKTHHYDAPQTVSWSKRSLECRNSVENAGGFTGGEKGLESGIRRKNLAVFVSGGGSNFRSIHEACLRGSVHGDIVVLATNKSGIIFCFNLLFIRLIHAIMLLFWLLITSKTDWKSGCFLKFLHLDWVCLEIFHTYDRYSSFWVLICLFTRRIYLQLVHCQFD